MKENVKNGHRSRSTLFRLLSYCVPYWHYFAFAVLMGSIKFLRPIGIAWVFGEAIDVLNNYVAGEFDTNNAWGELLRLFGVGCGIALLAPLPVYLRSYYGNKGVQLALRSLRIDLFSHIQKLSHSFFECNRSGSITSHIMSDVEAIEPFLGRTMVQIWMNFIVLVVVFTFFFTQSMVIGLLSVALVPIQIFILLTIGRRARLVSRATRARVAAMSGVAQERLAAPTEIKSFTMEDNEQARFEESSDELVYLGVRKARLDALNQVAVSTLNSLAPLLVILVGGYLGMFAGAGLSIGLLVQFVMMQSHIYSQFENLSQTMLLAANAMGATDRVFSIFDTTPEVRDRAGARKAGRFRGEIAFDNVSFSYPGGGGKGALEQVNLCVPAYSSVAFVGPSGAGKSTLFNLINRFYDVSSGGIKIDGADIRDFTIHSLRAGVGMVPQDAVLFSMSAYENILIGKPDADMDQVIEAAENAGALEFIEELPEKFETQLGERGARLSGGQRQRIAIARAFLKNPAILLLDEATSALDSESERRIQSALDRLMQNRTSLVIAHRLSTVVNCSKLVVLDQGKVVEEGTHSELVARDGLYRRLAKQQFGPGDSGVHPFGIRKSDISAETGS